MPHWEIGAELGILDIERAVKISGSMFTMYRRQGATLARALCQLALDRNADAFEEVRPPTLVRTDTITATGQLPKFADDAYHLERDDLWCIPTAEVPLTSLCRDEILDEADLPMRLMAYTPCFRREAGSAGRDTRGLLRVHEFDKVEMLAYTTPEQAPAMLDEILARAEALIADARASPTGSSTSAPATWARATTASFDIEVYAPGVDQWLEVSSVSWFSDYQARRANIRYRPAEGKGTEHRAHAQRLGPRRAPRVGGDRRDPSPGRRLGAHPRGAAAVHRAAPPRSADPGRASALTARARQPASPSVVVSPFVRRGRSRSAWPSGPDHRPLGTSRCWLA